MLAGEINGSFEKLHWDIDKDFSSLMTYMSGSRWWGEGGGRGTPDLK